MEKYRFMSPAWIEMAREQITTALSGVDLGRREFTLCEEFTNPPNDLRREGAATIGFYVRIVDGGAEVGDDPIDDADFKVVSDYEDALAIARDPDASAAGPELMQERIAAGTLKIIGKPSDVPTALAKLDIHRLLSSRTL